MEWTTKKRYQDYKSWDAEYLLKLQAQQSKSDYSPRFHVAPTSGLLNDPNGFSYFNNKFHLFYQSFPFGPVHGLKSWVHLESKDLVNWKNLGLSLTPSNKFDSHGAYSGSAIVIDNKLRIMYTGNHRDKDWKRKSTQLFATMDLNNNIKKDVQSNISAPENVTEHFRDPQIIKNGDNYYVLLGAQDKSTLKGNIAVFRSNDLSNWDNLGYLNFTKEDTGYMIECPNLIFLDDKPVLIFCPQGMSKDNISYNNIYPNTYLVGDNVDLDSGKFESTEKIKNLDEGFDVYATQAFNGPNNKAYAVSWIGLPNIKYPTDSENWAHCLSLVKELSIENNKLIQKPVESIKELRNKHNIIHSNSSFKASENQYELKIKIPANNSGKISLCANGNMDKGLFISFSSKNNAFIELDRSNTRKTFAEEYGVTRKLQLSSDKNIDLDIFVDNSVIEIFVNNGENVMTSRFFNEKDDKYILLTNDNGNDLIADYWELKSI